MRFKLDTMTVTAWPGGNDSRSWNSAHLTNCSSVGLDATAGAGYFYCFAL